MHRGMGSGTYIRPRLERGFVQALASYPGRWSLDAMTQAEQLALPERQRTVGEWVVLLDDLDQNPRVAR